MSKNNVRTFRFSDYVLEILLNYEGKNMNEQFEFLVMDCFAKLPEAREEIKNLDEQIRVKKLRLRELSDYINCVDTIKSDLYKVRNSVDSIVSKCNLFANE